MHKGLPTLSISRDRLREGPIRFEGSLDMLADWGPDGFELREPPRVVLDAEESADRGVHVSGTLTARLLETCRRCLDAVERVREIELDLRFEPDLDPWEEGPGLYALNGDLEQLELGPALREELILGLPEYPLCRPECEGLCPRCGTNLNENDCDCAEESGDPRWEALRHQLAPEGSAARDEEQDD